MTSQTFTKKLHRYHMAINKTKTNKYTCLKATVGKTECLQECLLTDRKPLSSLL